MVRQLLNLLKLSFDWPGLHWLELIFINYYWVLVFSALLNIFFKITWFSSTIYPILIYIVVILERKRLNVNYFDYLWMLYLLVVLFSWLVNDYPFKYILILRCISEQFAYSMCYWIVRKNPKLSANNIIECSYFPLLITSIMGIYFYFSPPSWYMSMTKEGTTDFTIMEFLRLRSIFPDSYIISYFLGIAIVYILVQMAKGKLLNKKFAYLFIGVFSITLFLTLTRSIIVAVLVGVLVIVIYSIKYHKLSNVKPILVGLIMIIFTSSLIIMNLEGYEKDFFTSKIASITDENASENVEERLFLNKKTEYALVGDGVGRHNMYADKYIKSSLRDGEYNKLIVEQGYIGFLVFIIIVVSALYKCLKNFDGLLFELIMILFLLLSMIAANPISTGDKHPIIYWLILGQIANYKKHNI